MREINIPRFMISRDMLNPEKMGSLLFKVLFFQMGFFETGAAFHLLTQ